MNKINCLNKIAPEKTALALAVFLSVPASVLAQDRPKVPTFTTAQADRGQAAYLQDCQDCHGSTLDNGEFGGPPLKGGYFRTRWGTASVAVLSGYISMTMPPDRPGQLSPQTYTDLVAFILSSNGYSPGDKELPSEQSAQQNMSLQR